MLFEKVKIQILLNLDTIRQVDNIQKDRRYVEWNKLPEKKRNLIFREVDIYKDPNFQIIKNANFQEKIPDSPQNEDIDNETETQAKQYKKKKISKVDKYHIKDKKHEESISSSRIQQKRRKQLEEKQKKYRISRQKYTETGKKQPKQLQSSKQSVKKSKFKQKKTPGIRNNLHLNQSSLSQSRQTKRSDYNQEESYPSETSYSSISEQEESSFSSQGAVYSKSKSKAKSKTKSKQKNAKSSSKKRNQSESKKKQPIVKPQKLSYMLQQSGQNQNIRQKFEKQVLTQVPGRKAQAQKIFQLILQSQNGSSTPICLHGNTGCGKTSLITKMLNFVLNEFPKNFSTAYLNCMSLWNVNHVYSGILYSLFGVKEKRSERALNNLFQCSQQLAKTAKIIDPSKTLSTQIQKTKIIVLDEIDHFIKDQTFFYNLLEWTHIKNSKIILIMISNILDLSVKLSAKIQSRMKFESIVFKPYSHAAIEQILKYKYPEAAKIFEPRAMNFLCIKVASINSDIRLLEKIYEDVITHWSQANGLTVERDQQQKENVKDSQNILQEKDEQSAQSKQSKHSHTHISLPKSSKQRKKLIQSLLRLSQTKRLKIEDVQKSQYLTGQLANQLLPQILQEYEIIMQVLHNARRKEDVYYPIHNATYLKQKRMPTSQETFLKMCELKDMGLIEFRENTRNCDVVFQGFGIMVSKELHLMCPERNLN